MGCNQPGQEELIGLRHGFEPAVVIFHDTAPPGDTAKVRLLAEFPTSPPAAVDSDTTIYVVDVDGYRVVPRFSPAAHTHARCLVGRH